MAACDESWRGKGYSFFENRACECFPCHKWESDDGFNCLFCYCPLYLLGDQCGGNFTMTENGIKDCTDCLIPHRRDNYGYILSKFNDACREMRKNDAKADGKTTD